LIIASESRLLSRASLVDVATGAPQTDVTEEFVGLTPPTSRSPAVASPLFVLLVCSAFTVAICTMDAIGIALVIGSKWLMIGQREPGKHTWDQSTYLIRWKLWFPVFAGGPTAEAYFGGSAFFVMFHRALGAIIGKDVCLSPQGNGLLLPEPDLVQIGDNACVNASTIVCHNNNGGFFELATIDIRERATLRSGSRVMNHSVVSADSRLLEHTLVIPGDVVSEGATWQGWPSKGITCMKKHTVLSDVPIVVQTPTTTMLALL